jgi:uncharacterized protein YndB with AHSA1/START domain
MGTAFQGLSEIVIQAGPERVYAILEDSTLLPHWAPMVKHTTGTTERVGSVRTCLVEWEGRADQIVERCVEAVPNKMIAWVMEQGMMTRMFSKVSFWFKLEPKGSNTTLLRLGFLYEPRHILARLMYPLMMRRKFEQLRQTLLENIKDFVEQRSAKFPRT